MSTKLMSFFKKNSFLVYSCLVLIISFSVFFTNYASPAGLYWDENYHIAAAYKYVNGTFFIELHPPLGKLLIALGEIMFGHNKDLDTSGFLTTDYISGEIFPQGFSFAGVRFFPTLFAFLAAYIFFILLYLLSKNEHIAFLFTGLYVFDNALVLHFKGAMLDGIQMFFILCCLAYFVYLWQNNLKKWWHYLVLGLLIGLVVSTKINGLVMVLLFGFLQLKAQNLPDFFASVQDFWQKRTSQSASYIWTKLKPILYSGLAQSASFVAGIILVFSLVQYIHMVVAKKIVQNRTYEVSNQYQEILDTKQTANPLNTWIAIRDWKKFSDTHTKGVPKLDVCKEGENGSYPLSWPLMNKTISYRWERYPILKKEHQTYPFLDTKFWASLIPVNQNGYTDSLDQHKISLDEHSKLPPEQKKDYVVAVKYLYLVGNPLVWLIGLIGIILSLVMILGRYAFGLKVKDKNTFYLILCFSIMYLAYMFTVLQVDRVLYLYHYFVPLVFSLILAYLIFFYKTKEELQDKRLSPTVYGLAAFWMCLVFAVFLFYSPFTYYLPITKSEFDLRSWFEFWKMNNVG